MSRNGNGGNGLEHGPKGTGEGPGGRPERRTRAEAMGIPPALGKGQGDLRRQLEAAEEALEKARAEASEAQERYIRLAAEMDNVRRRHRQEQADQLQYANSELITQLLPVLDNFHRALDHAAGEASTGEAPSSSGSGPAVAAGGEGTARLVSGLLLVVRQLEDMLASQGVVSIDAVGQTFDPKLHQAVLAEPSAEHEEGQVIEELQRGYMLHDRVLRPSLVKIAHNS